MSLLICVPGRDISTLVEQLSERLGEDVIEVWPEINDPHGVEFVLGWNPPCELWQQLPNVKGVMSFGAGVDGLGLEYIPQSVDVSRVVDPALADDMAEYVLAQVLFYKQRIGFYLDKQGEQIWKPRRAQKGQCVGILGLGEIGRVVATRLHNNGFSVCGWSRTPKQLDGIETYSGKPGLYSMLPKVDYLVCLLPLTPDTRGMLDAELFNAMNENAVLINVGRGAHLVEEDLLAALDSGKLAAACLDVFAVEPLAQDHPFWLHPQVRVTPHCSALTSLDTVAEQIATNYLRVAGDEKMLNTIDREQNY